MLWPESGNRKYGSVRGSDSDSCVAKLIYHQCSSGFRSLKLLLSLGALLLSGSPAIAADVLYLRCKASVDMLITNSVTSQVIEDRTIDEIYFFKVDLKNKTILDSRSERLVGITVQDKTIVIPQKFDDEELWLDDLTQIDLEQSNLYSASGKAIYRPRNQEVSYRAEGLCMEIDASGFVEVLSQ